MFYKIEQIIFCSLSVFLATGCSVKDDQYEYSYEYSKNQSSNSPYYVNSYREKTQEENNHISTLKNDLATSDNNFKVESIDTPSNIQQNSANSSYIHETNKHTVKPYVVLGKKYYPMSKVAVGYKEDGIASWYGPKFNNKKTASGEMYDMYKKTAAHKTLPMGTIVKVTNKDNGKSTVVKINDRGPFVSGRIIDLSYVAGKEIGIDKTGTAPVTLEVLNKNGKNDISNIESNDKKLIVSSNKNIDSPTHGLKPGYYVQVGAFSNIVGAKIYQKKYAVFGNKVYIKKHKYKDGKILHKVLIGGLNSYSKAVKFKYEHNIKESYIYKVEK